MSAERPNVLFIHSDQHRFDCLGVNGHPLVKTPNLDRLAAEGMNFTQAYTPIPVCVPARHSLAHGRWPSEHQVICNWHTEVPFPPEQGLPSYSQLLRAEGYYLAHVGKWQVHPTQGPLEDGFHDDAGGTKAYEAWRAAQGIPPRPHRQGWLGELDPHIGPSSSRLAWGAGQVVCFLEKAAALGQLFFIQWDPEEPHLPHVLPEPYFSMYSPDDIPPWPSFPDPLVGKPYIQAQQRRTWQVDGWGWPEWAPIVARYLGEITQLDVNIGRLLDALVRLGLAQNTLVVYSTDHGDLCGGHGMMDKHYVMYDDVVRVPLIVRWPGRIRPGSACAAFVSHGLDLAATFCDVAGLPIPPAFSGQSLLPLFAGAQDNGRSDIFSMYYGNQFGLYSQRLVRDRRWKYVWNATAEDELYNLAADPAELRNLAAAPTYREELGRLRCRLVAWMEAVHDPLLNGWTRAQLLEGLKG